MNAAADALCGHCLLPVGMRGMQRKVDGESRTFCCYGCCIAHQVKGGRTEEWEAAWLLIRLGVGGFLSMNIMLFSLLLYTDAFTGIDANMLPVIHALLWTFATPAVLILGGPFARETWVHAWQGRLTSSALIVLGVGAAYVYSAYAVLEGGAHVYFDTASMVLMLFTVGRYLEAAGRARAARDLHPLLAAESEWANVVDGDAETRRSVRDVQAGVLVRVAPGARIPVDGFIVDGLSHIDEAVMTGESRQLAKGVGAAVFAGSINLDGPLLIRSSGAGNATRWAQICRSVCDALLRQSPIQRIADRAVGLAVPFVLCLGALALLYWSTRMPFDRAMLIGLSVLVVACPCAVGLAAPLATSIAIGRLARLGCVVREAGVFETLAAVRLIAFDKTGTLTEGRPRLVAIETDGLDPDELLARAAGLERHCEHALAQAVTDAARHMAIEPFVTADVRVLPGRGVQGRGDGRTIAAGNAALMQELGWPMAAELERRAAALETSGHSAIYVGCDGQVRGMLAFDDTPLAEARATVAALRERGLAAVLLSGDNRPAAERAASVVGIDDIRAGLSPDAKLTQIEQEQARAGAVAMVGDGLNDGPVLAAADVGIAVGSATDLARETAALVLPPGGLWLLPFIVDMARAMRRTILTNLLWAFGYNLIALTMAACGLLQPILAAAVMAGSSLLVVLNSLRLERLPDPVALPAALNAHHGALSRPDIDTVVLASPALAAREHTVSA